MAILPLMAIFGAGALVVFIGFAVAVLAMRGIFSRVLGGVSGASLAGACGLVEVGVIVMVAIVAR